MNIYNHDSVKDVAESLGINSLSDEVAKNLAQDVEYRIHAIIQEANKFMRHAKRSTMRTSDISMALRVLNVEPLYGFAANNPITYREAPLAPGQPPLYYIEDEEVEFEKIINAPLPKIPRDVAYTAHWLAVEGVQPAIPQNPVQADARAESSQQGIAKGPEVSIKPQVKHVLSKELLLYFERISKAAYDEFNETLRTAAIASLRNDPGLHQLVPYFVQSIAEKVTHNLKDLFILNTAMQMAWALLDNPNLFIEPYIHQLMPPILTCLIARQLGGKQTIKPDPEAHYDLRDLAASILHSLCHKYGHTYQTLRPRVTKTLLKAYLDNQKPLTTHYGAIIGLTRMGPEVVRAIVLPNAGIYELVLIPELNSSEPERRREAQRCKVALEKALESIKADALPADAASIVGSKSDEEIHSLLITRVGSLLAEYISQQSDQTLLKIIMST